MNLFDSDINIKLSEKNLLPYDGEVNYFEKLFSEIEANYYFKKLFETIDWQNDEVILFGKKIITKRKVAWYAEADFNYTYSNSTKKAIYFTNELLELKKIIEQKTNSTYNACLLNLYHNGNEGMGWHSDNEKTIIKNSTIASLSFGADRKFEFKHKATAQKIAIVLQNASLLAMKANTQLNWLHTLPKSTKVLQPRINLTFRNMVV